MNRASARAALRRPANRQATDQQPVGQQDQAEVEAEPVPSTLRRIVPAGCLRIPSAVYIAIARVQTAVQTNASQRDGTEHHAHHCRLLRMAFRTDATTPDRTIRDLDQEPLNPKVEGSIPSRPMARDRFRRARTDPHRLPSRHPNLGQGQRRGQHEQTCDSPAHPARVVQPPRTAAESRRVEAA